MTFSFFKINQSYPKRQDKISLLEQPQEGGWAPTTGNADVKYCTACNSGYGLSDNQCVTGITLNGTDKSETLTGTIGNDIINGFDGLVDTLIGLAGDDILNGGDGSDILLGGAGDDTLNAGPGSFHILNGGPGADALNGGTEHDIFEGGPGADTINGGAGIWGGNDTATYVNSSIGVAVYLKASEGSNTGEAAGDTFNSIEDLTGSEHNDILQGDTSNNMLKGGLGSDILTGGDGKTILSS